MSSVTPTSRRPRRCGRLLAAASLAALSVVVAPIAQAPAAQEPTTGGTTTLTFELPKKVKPQAISPATANGSALTLSNASGTADLATGRADLTLGGGVRLKGKGGKADLTTLKLLAGGAGQLSAQLKGKTVILATVTGPLEATSAGAAVNNAVATLTEDGAKALNKAVAKKKKKKGKGKAVASKKKKKGGKPFKTGNRLATVSTTLPLSMVDVRGQGQLSLEPNPALALTFLGKGVVAVGGITAVPPATGGTPNPTNFPVTGGRVAPDLSSGQITSAGGLQITKNTNLPGGCPIPMGRFLRESNLVVDLEREQLLATVDSNSGNLGTGIVAANIDMSQATQNVSPGGEVTITDMQPRITDVSAQTLNFLFGSAAQGCGADFTGGTSLGMLSVTTQLGR
jgi:hypothetical protein